MSRGLHLLGYDWMKGASSMTAAFADGFSRDAAKKRIDADQMVLASQLQKESNTMWYVGGAAVLAVLVVLLVRSR